MAVETRPRHDPLTSAYNYPTQGYSSVQFTDPWASNVMPQTTVLPNITALAARTGHARSSSSPYNTLQDTSNLEVPSMTVGRQHLSSPSMMPSSAEYYNQDGGLKFGGGSSFSADHSQSGGSSVGSPTQASQYTMSTYQQQPSYDYQAHQRSYSFSNPADRRLSQPTLPSSSSSFGSPMDAQRQRQSSMVDFRGAMGNTIPLSGTARDSIGDALDSARGMVAMSQTQAPRSLLGLSRQRQGSNSTTSTYYPTHSASSSISSTSNYPAYFGGSIDSSSTDYSDSGFDLNSRSYVPMHSRRANPISYLTASAALGSGPQSMMSTFNSKASSSTQKKHKCKVCDKRFTRPSSLQTHTYSHTGEKPFTCEVEGCGRQFSVVSNLRRHKKVHKHISNGN